MISDKDLIIMAKWMLSSKRKKTGGLLQRHAKKKKYQHGRDLIPAVVGETRKKIKRTKGGSAKIIAKSINIANIIAEGKAHKVRILSVVDNKADSHFVRRNVITKGAIIQTELGKARVTSRPGQEGVVNAALIEKKGYS